MSLRLFHGGKPGLKKGDRITAGEPHFVDGCAICEAHQAGLELAVGGTIIDPANHEPERVFVTTDREYARFYASKYPHGDLYSVDPVGELLPSAADPFPSWHVAEAIVRGPCERRVELSWPQRRRLSKRWEAHDGE